MNYHHPPGQRSGVPERPIPPSSHGSAIAAFFLGAVAPVFGPVTGIHAILIARGVARDIREAPQRYSGGLVLATAGGLLGAVFSALWLAVVARLAVIDTPRAATIASVFGGLLVAVTVLALVSAKTRPLVSKMKLGLLSGAVFVLVAPSTQFFVRRNTLSRQCDASMGRALALLEADSMNGSRPIEDIRHGLDQMGLLFDDAERACRKAEQPGELERINKGRAWVTRMRAETEAQIAVQVAAWTEAEKAKRAASALEEARESVTTASAKARLGDWSGMAQALMSADSGVRICRGTSLESDAAVVRGEIAALRKKYKPQLEAITAAQEKALEAREKALAIEAAKAAARTRSSAMEANVRGERVDAELLVPSYIRDHMKDPDSYEYVSGIGSGTANGPFWVISWTWRGTNSFGMTVQSTGTFCVSAGTAKSVIPSCTR